MKIKELDKLQTFLQEIATPLNIEVIEVEFKQGKNPELTIYIDKDGGVDLDTCELFHNAIFDTDLKAGEVIFSTSSNILLCKISSTTLSHIKW